MAWHQLTYASSEGTAGGPGGWQVLGQEPADMPDPIREQLRARVVTRLLEVTPTDEFANRAGLEARPRRLLYEPVREGLAWWHAASAGKDATGRPGNVFTHAALLTGAAGPLRPMDLWRSPDWLAPFGSAEVGKARLGDVGRPGPLGRDAAAAWIGEHAELLEPLLAAVTWMLEAPGRHVVLVTDTVDDFAAWVSAATYLTAPGLARQLPFVTFERAADGANELPASGFVGIPTADSASLRDLYREDTLVLDPRRLPEEPVAGSWEYDGQRWPTDPVWQDALYGASGLDPAALVRVLAVLDEIAAPITDNDRVAPGWPLALALLKVAPQRVQDRDELVAEWQRHRPWAGLTDPELLRVLGSLPTAAPPAPATGSGPRPEAAAEAGPRPDEMRILLAAAARLLQHGQGAPYADLVAARRCVHLLLTDGLPKKADPAALARAEAYLALGDEVPDAVRELLLEWTPAVSEGSRRG